MTSNENSAAHVISPVPAIAGIGLKSQHVTEILEDHPDIGWVEVHAENYMAEGGPPLADLDAIREHYPLSVHGVGLSLGSATGIDPLHLERFCKVVDRFRPALVSEHIAWSATGGVHLHDLLPVPYTEEALSVLGSNINTVQDALGRQILVENPSRYVGFADSPIPEPEFLNHLAQQTGCGLLLDVNNVVVSTSNMGEDALSWIDAIDGRHVGEIHLAGHTVKEVGENVIRIDDHGSPADEQTWSLFEHVLATIGPRPTLFEWDTEIPALPVLLAEAAKADIRLKAVPEKSEGRVHASA